jgi:hypothetical protein
MCSQKPVACVLYATPLCAAFFAPAASCQLQTANLAERDVCLCHVTKRVEQLPRPAVYKWNSTEALVFRVEQWNSVLLFLHLLCIYIYTQIRLYSCILGGLGLFCIPYECKCEWWIKLDVAEMEMEMGAAASHTRDREI